MFKIDNNDADFDDEEFLKDAFKLPQSKSQASHQFPSSSAINLFGNSPSHLTSFQRHREVENSKPQDEDFNLQFDDIDDEFWDDEEILRNSSKTVPGESQALFQSPHFQKEQTPKKKTVKRKFPGPAGILPELHGARPSNFDRIDQVISLSNECTSVKVPVNDELPCSQMSEDDFSKPVWLKLMEDFSCRELSQFNIDWIIKKATSKSLPQRKAPILLALLKSISIKGAEASAILKDRTGEIGGTIHRKLLEDYPNFWQPGTGVVLHQATVISPNARKHYLNITSSNLIYLYLLSNGVAEQTVLKDLSKQELIASALETTLEASRSENQACFSPMSNNLHHPRLPVTPRPTLFSPLPSVVRTPIPQVQRFSTPTHFNSWKPPLQSKKPSFLNNINQPSTSIAQENNLNNSRNIEEEFFEDDEFDLTLQSLVDLP